MTPASLISELREAIGAERVLDDAATREYFSHDLFWHGKPPACVVKPGDAEQVQAVVKLDLQVPDDLRCAVGRTVVHYEHVEWFGQCKNRADDGFGVFAFVVGGYNDES